MATRTKAKKETKPSNPTSLSKTSRVSKAPVVKTPSTKPSERPVLRFKRVHFFIILGGLLIIGALFALRGFFVAATVNGQPISRFSIVSELEKLYGKNSLEQRVTSAMIFQEAEKKDIKVSDEEIEKEYKKSEDAVKKQGQELNQVLAFRGYTPDTYKTQIKIQKIAEKMFSKDANVTDKEINDYLEQNKDTQPQDAKPEDLRANAKQSLMQQKIYTKYQEWVDKLRKSVKINYFVTY